MEAPSRTLEDYNIQAESPSLSPNTLSAMASASYSSNPSHRRAGSSPPRVTGLRSLHALAGQSPPTTDPDRLRQEPNEAVIITRLFPKKQTVVPVESYCETPSDHKKHPVSGESSTKADRPTLPENFSRLAARAKLKAVKQFLSAFEYKQTPATHFNTHKLRPLSRIMDTARMIIYSPQPINRQPDLMNKDLTFNCMSDIVENYKTAYEAAGHSVLKVRVGLPVEHQIQSPNYVCWRHLSLSPGSQTWEECRVALENHSMKKNRLWDLWLLAGKGGDPKRKSLTRKAALDTKVLVNDAMKKKKKVKTQDTTMKAFAETEQIRLQAPHSRGEVPVTSTYAEAKASKERKRGSSLAATKSLMKTRLLQSKTSFLIRQSAKCFAPKLYGYRNLPLPRGSLTSSQAKRLSKVSFNMDNRKQDLIAMKSKGKEQESGRGRIPKGKQQVSTGIRNKGKALSTPD